MALAVPLAPGRLEGFTLHIVACAPREQLSATVPEKPSIGETEMTFVNVAVCPGETVCVVEPEEPIE
jgi:hypothetical protein